MKRHESIAPLSREHHFGLLFCWKIRQGIKLNVEAGRMYQYVAYFWNTHLEEHFREEEEWLFKKINDALTRQALQEHQEIKQYLQQLKNAPKAGNLLQLANMINDHIRFEERTLFPHLEKVLTPGQLEEAGHLLHESIPGKTGDNYADEFWIRK